MGKRRENTVTLPRFNLNKPLRAFYKDEEVYIVDYDTGKVWRGLELKSTPYARWREEDAIRLPLPPSHYASVHEKMDGIGGIGATVRYTGLVKAHVDAKRKQQFTVVYATNIPDKDAFVLSMARVSEHITIGDFDDQDDDYGTVVDIYSSLQYLEIVCAQIARTGARIELDDQDINSRECIGAERLDRRFEEPRRAAENWRYSFIPEDWFTLPLLWTHMAANVVGVENIEDLPQPLQQHVVKMKRDASKDSAVRQRLATLLPRKRWVSGALSKPQTLQLLGAFYALYVEQVQDPIHRRLATCILFRYLFCRGYTARWMGKYDQDAEHLGNGKNVRKFKKLEQYDPQRLSVAALNAIYKPGGKLRGKGNKGTRSRYASDAERYHPKRRMRRPEDWSQRMRAEPVVPSNEVAEAHDSDFD